MSEKKSRITLEEAILRELRTGELNSKQLCVLFSLFTGQEIIKNPLALISASEDAVQKATNGANRDCFNPLKRVLKIFEKEVKVKEERNQSTRLLHLLIADQIKSIIEGLLPWESVNSSRRVISTIIDMIGLIQSGGRILRSDIDMMIDLIMKLEKVLMAELPISVHDQKIIKGSLEALERQKETFREE